MPISRSSLKELANRYCGFDVLLVETDKRSLQHHAYVLMQSSHRVITTMKITEAFSMVTRREFDCVMVDAECHDINLADFLLTIWSHGPQLRVIVMTSNESHLKTGRETEANDIIGFLRKPCGGTRICNMLQHLCRRKKLAFGEGTSSVIRRPFDNMIRSTIFKLTMVNNNLSSSRYGSNQLRNINAHKYGSMHKAVNFVDLTGDDDEDDESPTNKSFFTAVTGIKDKKKKKILELIRRNKEPRSKDGMNLQKGNDIPYTRIAWTHALHEKFLEAVTALGKEGAYPNAILKYMNVPDLTRAQVASHLQRLQEKEDFTMKPRVAEPIQKGTKLQAAGSYARKRSGLSNTSDHKKASRPNHSNIHHQKPSSYNSTGISCMTLGNIMDKMLGVHQQLPLPQQTTVNNSAGGYQATSMNIGFGLVDQSKPLIGNDSMNTCFTLVDQSEPSIGNDFMNTGSGLVNQLEPLIGNEYSKRNDFVLVNQSEPSMGNDSMNTGSGLVNQFEPSIGNDSMNTGSGLVYKFEPSIGNDSMSTGSGLVNQTEPWIGNAYSKRNDFGLVIQLEPSIGNDSMSNGFELVEQFETSIGNDSMNTGLAFVDQYEPSIGHDSMTTGFGLVEQFKPSIGNDSMGNKFEPLIGNDSMSNDFGLVNQYEPLIGNEYSMGNDLMLTDNSHGGSYGNNVVEPMVIEEGFVSHHATVEPQPQCNLADNANIFPSYFDNIVDDGLAPFDRFGMPVEPCLTVSGGVMEAPVNVGLDGFAFPNLVSNDHMGGVCYPDQVLQGIEERLFGGENETDAVNFGNSIVPMDGSEGRVIDDDWYLKMIHQEYEDALLNNNLSYF